MPPSFLTPGPRCFVPESRTREADYCSPDATNVTITIKRPFHCSFLHRSTVFHADPGASPPRGPFATTSKKSPLRAIKPILNCNVGNIGSSDEYFRATSKPLSLEYAQLPCAISRTPSEYHRVFIIISGLQIRIMHLSIISVPIEGIHYLYISTSSLNYQIDD